MKAPVSTTQSKRDVKLMQKRGKDMQKPKTLIGLLAAEVPLPAHYLDHPLRGDFKGHRDAHIEPDWLLIYKLEGDTLKLARTGTHADIFEE